MKNTTQKFTSTVLVDVLFCNEDLIKDIERKSRQFENWYLFNKITGLGRVYRQAELKVRICHRLLNINM
mgnify:CR=1 FL=1